MTDRVYLLRMPDGTRYEKFFTSPYNAMIKAAKIQNALKSLKKPPQDCLFESEMYVVDIEDVPCDHTVAYNFVSGFVNAVHEGTHNHGFAMLEKSTCLYDVKVRGQFLCSVMVVYIPPDPEDVNDVGTPVFQTYNHAEPVKDLNVKSKIGEFALMFESYVIYW